MRKLQWLAVVALLAILGFGQMPERLEAQTNLLSNPSFEEPYSNGAAQGWGRWHEEAAKVADCAGRYSVQPKWGPEFNGAIILDGARSQAVGNQFDTWRGGVVQDVAVTAGTTYRFSAWGWLRTSNDQYPAASDRSTNPRIRVGIDPTGSGLWTSSAIVWSNAISPHDAWQQTAVEATATGAKISVFVEADFTGTGFCRAHLDAWFDKAELTTSAPPPTNTPVPQPTSPPVVVQPTAVPPTAAPTAVPTETPVPSPTPIPPTPTPTGGSICINAFGDTNANGLHETNEGYMAGIRFTIAQGGGIVSEGVSPGTATPVCFEGLPTGAYQVAQTVPGTLEMTTVGNITINVEEGKTVGIEFGSRVKQAAPATEVATQPTATATVAAGATAVPTEGEGALQPTETASSAGLGVWGLVGLGVIGLAVVLLMVLLAVVVMQQRKA